MPGAWVLDGLEVGVSRRWLEREGFQCERTLAVERRGGRPVNRLRSWGEDECQKKKELQDKNWFRAGGFDVPLFVPHTPKGELARRMKENEVLNNICAFAS